MYCTTCGSQVNDGAKFCSECGASLSGNKAATNRDDTAPVKSRDDFIKFVVKTCNSVRLNSDDKRCIEIGEPAISIDSSQLDEARKNFRIPDSEDVYLIFSANYFAAEEEGADEKLFCDEGYGLAICTSGLYYCGGSGKISFLSWQKFKDVQIEFDDYQDESGDTLYVGDEYFSAEFVGRKVAMILEDIQNYLR